MLKLPVEVIIQKIHKETGLSKEEIERQIKSKIAELDSLVSQEGAAFIVASELGVQLLSPQEYASVDIKALAPGMKGVDVSGRVEAVWPVKSFVRAGQAKEVASLRLADSTGEVRVVLWDEKPQLVKDKKIKFGSVLRIKNAVVRQNQNGEKELHAGSRSSIVVTSTGDLDIKSRPISELKPGDRAEILAEVVNIFEPRLYPTCSSCNRKVIPAPEGFLCSEHRQVVPVDSALLSFQLDDGSGVIRSVAFRKVAESLCGLTAAEIKSSGPELMDKINSHLLGRTIEVRGRVKENKNFARIELIVNEANLSPDPKELALKILEGKNGEEEN